METVILGFLFAVGKLIVISKVWGLPRALYFEKWIDVFFTLVLPLMFFGTYSGAILAIFSGLWLSVLLRIARIFISPITPDFILNRRNKNKRR